MASGAGVAPASEQETLLEGDLLDSEVRAHGIEAPEPTSDIIPLVHVPPPGRDADKYIGCTIDGRYVVQEVLGEGGMGVVYRCRRRVFDKTVAVKILRSDLAKSSEATERFVTEAKAASAIGNAHIVDVLDFGELPDGSTYFAMEFLQGPTLAELIASGDLVGDRRVVGIAVQIADGLAAAHDARIVHRDLKPDNVFVEDENGSDFVKIVDFGIAKVVRLQNKITRAGAIFGTPHYMSPEQCRGSSVDRRTDVYSLGVILYEMISGSVPFDAENPLSILSQHLHDPPLPPSQLDSPPEMPAGLEALILRCLAKEPEDRFQSMSDVAAALRAVQRGEPLEELEVHISVTPPEPDPVESVPAAMTASLPAPPPVSSRPAPASAPTSGRGSTLTALDAAVRDAALERELEQVTRKRRGAAYGLVLLVAAALVAYVVMTTQGTSGSLPEVVQAGRPVVFAGGYADRPVKEVARPKKTVALVLSPIDARVYRGREDLGTMPLSVDVEEGQTVALKVKRAGYWPRNVKVTGRKDKLLIRLAPISGSPLVAPSKERTAKELGFKEGEKTEAPGEEQAEPPLPATTASGAPPAATAAPPDKPKASPQPPAKPGAAPAPEKAPPGE